MLPPRNPPPNSSSVCAIIVTYRPDLEILERQMQQLPSDCNRVVVDNSGDACLAGQLEGLLSRFGARLVFNAHNVGLAQAQNQGASEAKAWLGNEIYLLFLDQDTEPGERGLECLLAAYHAAAESQGAGAAGPLMVDVSTGLDHGFHVMRGWRWSRVHPARAGAGPVHCANLNASGTLVPLAVFEASGGMDAGLFIDHVDTDWSFRMRSRGYHLYGMPNVRFSHRMGEASRRIWLLGWKVWPLRSPLRHYYLYRNAVRLMKRDYVPSVWKAWAVAKLVMTAAVTVLVDPRRGAHLREMARGLAEGARRADFRR